MTIDILKSIIGGLAQSQGSYGRMKEELDNGDKWESLLDIVNENNIKDAVDLVMFLEG